MLDLHFLRENPDDANRRLARRDAALSVDDVLELDLQRRSLLTEVESLKKERNERSKEIGKIMKSGGDAAAAREGVKQLGSRIDELGQRLEAVQRDLDARLHELPNLPHPDTPVGTSAADNPVLRTWGDLPRFAFEPRAHWDIGAALGILDFERAAKISGARFSVLFGAGARMERALIQFMLDLHTREHGYVETLPPFMVHAPALFGTGQLPKFADDLFKVQPGDFYLIPTAEVPLTNLHNDEILEADCLPFGYCAYTPCFRSEAGSYGQDVRGLIRQHQFNKVELVRFSRPEDSYAQLDLLTGHAEEVLRRLELHYQVVSLCTGDLGFGAARTHDLEVWLPSQGVFREISSCSNFEDFQARRAKIRYRAGATGKPAPLHTLNGSGLAVGRTLVAILENYQERDGSVVIPPALRPYMDGMERIEARP